MKSQGIKLILGLKVKLNWMRNCFNKLPSVKHCEEWKHSAVLPPSETFLFIMTLMQQITNLSSFCQINQTTFKKVGISFSNEGKIFHIDTC